MKDRKKIDPITVETNPDALEDSSSTHSSGSTPAAIRNGVDVQALLSSTELSELTGVLEKMSRKLVQLAFLVASLGDNSQDGIDGKQGGSTLDLSDAVSMSKLPN